MKILIIFSFFLLISISAYSETEFDITYKEFKEKVLSSKSVCVPSKKGRAASYESITSNLDYWHNIRKIKTSDYTFETREKELKELLENPVRQGMRAPAKGADKATALYWLSFIYRQAGEYEKSLNATYELWELDSKCYKNLAFGLVPTILSYIGQEKKRQEILYLYKKLWEENPKFFKRYLKFQETKIPIWIYYSLAENHAALGQYEKSNSYAIEILKNKGNENFCEAKARTKLLLLNNNLSKKDDHYDFPVNVLYGRYYPQAFNWIAKEIEPWKSTLSKLNSYLPLSPSNFDDVIEQSNSIRLPAKERFEKESDYQNRLKVFKERHPGSNTSLYFLKIPWFSYDVENESIYFRLDEYEEKSYEIMEDETYKAQNAFGAERMVTIHKRKVGRVRPNSEDFRKKANYGFNPFFLNSKKDIEEKNKETYSSYLERIEFPLSTKEARESYDDLEVFLILEHSNKVTTIREQPAPTYDYPTQYWYSGVRLETNLKHIVLFNKKKGEIVNYLTTDLRSDNYEACNLSNKLDSLTIN